MSENTSKNYGVCDECSTIIDEDELVALFYDDGSEIKLCKKCYALRFGTSEPPEKPRTDAVDIHKIIDDAMEKGDRSVYILIHSGGMSVTINPYVEEKPKWLHIGNGHFKCSDCGNDYDANCNPLPVYCGCCGEKLYGIKDMLEDNDEEET